MTKDLTNQRFGRLVAIKATGEFTKKGQLWECKCDCGNTYVAPTSLLLENEVKSCGCLKKEQDKINLKPNYNEMFKDGTSPRIKFNTTQNNNTSGVRGVSWHKGTGKWQARINFKKKSISLGYFDNLEDAKKAREEAETRYFGKYLNKHFL